MLSLHGLGAAGEGAAGYYTALARDDYYTQGGEPAGHWFGQGAAALGLSGTVDETALRHVLHGFDGAGDGGRLQSPQRLGGPAGVAPPVLAQIHHLGIAPEGVHPGLDRPNPADSLHPLGQRPPGVPVGEGRLSRDQPLPHLHQRHRALGRGSMGFQQPRRLFRSPADCPPLVSPAGEQGRAVDLRLGPAGVQHGQLRRLRAAVAALGQPVLDLLGALGELRLHGFRHAAKREAAPVPLDPDR